MPGQANGSPPTPCFYDINTTNRSLRRSTDRPMTSCGTAPKTRNLTRNQQMELPVERFPGDRNTRKRSRPSSGVSTVTRGPRGPRGPRGTRAPRVPRGPRRPAPPFRPRKLLTAGQNPSRSYSPINVGDQVYCTISMHIHVHIHVQ